MGGPRNYRVGVARTADGKLIWLLECLASLPKNWKLNANFVNGAPVINEKMLSSFAAEGDLNRYPANRQNIVLFDIKHDFTVGLWVFQAVLTHFQMI